MKSLNNTQLKIIACISMFLDHFGAIFIYELIKMSENTLLTSNPMFTFALQNRNLLIEIYSLLRIIGRIAFPIYCFLIVEGFIHTKNVYKYCIRLFIFALLSEFAFDIGFNHSLLEFTSNNVFFTLGLGLLLLIVVSKIRNIILTFKDKSNKFFLIFGICLMSFGIVFLFMELADNILSSDYGFSGVLCILCMYVFRKNIGFGYSLGVFITYLLNNSYLQLYALFGLFFVLRYNGEKGKSIKYLFYLYYPLHILLIAGICYLVGIRGSL